MTYKTYEMRLEGDTGCITRPGQFVNIAIPGKYLRRPISVCGVNGNELTLLYDVVGEGTSRMSRMQPGEKLDILTGLGNGFNTEVSERPILLGGGIGCAPLYQLGVELLKRGKRPIAVLGYNTKEDIPSLPERMEEMGMETYIATVDGSVGVKGFVTDVIREKGLEFDYFYACGPMPMLKAVCKTIEQPGEVSIESRMGCGFGICVCCSVETISGAKRICKEGPVFRKEELIWK